MVTLDNVLVHFDSTKEAFKLRAKALMQPQGVIQRCELMGQAPRTEALEFEVASRPKAAAAVELIDDPMFDAARPDDVAVEVVPQVTTLEYEASLILGLGKTRAIRTEFLLSSFTARFQPVYTEVVIDSDVSDSPLMRGPTNT